MQTKYKDHTINYDERGEFFVVHIDDSAVSDKSLSKLKDKLDKLEKKGFKRKSVIFISPYRDNPHQKATITSIENEENVWITKGDGRREKVSLSRLIVDNDTNKNLLQQIDEYFQSINLMNSNISDLKKQFMRLSIEELKS